MADKKKDQSELLGKILIGIVFGIFYGFKSLKNRTFLTIIIIFIVVGIIIHFKSDFIIDMIFDLSNTKDHNNIFRFLSGIELLMYFSPIVFPLVIIEVAGFNRYWNLEEEKEKEKEKKKKIEDYKLIWESGEEYGIEFKKISKECNTNKKK